MKLQAFFTSEDSLLGNIIKRATGGQYMHVGLLFTTNEETLERMKCAYPDLPWQEVAADPAGKVRFYFESSWSKDKHTGKTGVRGPYSIEKLLNWKNRHKSRHVEIEDIKVNGNVFNAILLLQEARRAIHYAHWQLYQNFKMFKFNKGISLNKRSRRKWTCSETVVRIIHILDANFARDRFEIGEYIYDEYAPSSVKGPGIYEMLTKQGV